MNEIKLKKKVCIVGSGFCGYAAYQKLKAQNIDLILVEGGKEKTPNSDKDQNFYKVVTNKFLTFNGKYKVNNKLEPSFRDRKFTLGGSSECWAGWIKPLEESTYKNNFNENPNQSWGNLRLDNYEKEVLRLLNSPIDNFDTKLLSTKLNLNLPQLTNGLEYSIYAWAKEDLKLKNYWMNKINTNINFDKNNNEKDLVLGFKLIEYSKKENKINSLIFINELKNRKLYVEADYFLLCMGGIENAKFTTKLANDLDSKNLMNQYIGNFQEHPHLYNIAHFNKGKNELPNIITGRINISEKIHNSFNDGTIKFAISAWNGPGTPKVTFSIIENKPRKLINRLKKGLKNIIKNKPVKGTLPNSDYFITMRCEQTWNKDSKLKFNSNITRLDWKVKDSDFKYYSDYLKNLSSFLILNGFAKDVYLSSNSKNHYAIPNEIDGGAHHMGTVPFLKNKLLINEKFQFSSLKNLYIVGSSAFPSSGFENPTHAAMATSLIATEDIIEKINKKNS